MPEELVVQAQPLGVRLKWIKISGQGPNALDFHIAYYLGEELSSNQSLECAILSRDTGFDPPVRHLQTLAHTYRRVSSLKDASPAQKRAAHPDHFARLLMLLARPIKPRSLAGKVKSWFPHLEDGERLALIRRLYTESRVRESNNTLSYELTAIPAEVRPMTNRLGVGCSAFDRSSG